MCGKISSRSFLLTHLLPARFRCRKSAIQGLHLEPCAVPADDRLRLNEVNVCCQPGHIRRNITQNKKIIPLRQGGTIFGMTQPPVRKLFPFGGTFTQVWGASSLSLV